MDRNTVIGFVLIGILLIAMMTLNSKNQREYQGTPETAIRNFLGALVRKDQKDLENTVIGQKGASGIAILKKVITNDQLFNGTVKFDTASLVLSDPAEENGKALVNVSDRNNAAPLKFQVSLDEHSQYKVVIDDPFVLGLLQHQPKLISSFDPQTDSVYKQFISELSPQIQSASAPDTTTQQLGSGNWFAKSKSKEEIVYLENEFIKVAITANGGMPKSVELKKYKKFDGSPVVLNADRYNKLAYNVNNGVNQTAYSDNLYFKPFPVVKNTDNSNVLVLEAGEDSLGKKITHRFVVHPNDYMLDFTIDIAGADQVFSQRNLQISWQVQAPRIEKDHAYELTQSHFCYNGKEGFDFEYLAQSDTKDLDKTSWICVKQQFFLSALLAKNEFSNVHTSWSIPSDTSYQYLAQVNNGANLTLPAGKNISIPMQLYYGPSDYNILKKYGNQMENVVPYGNGIFAFVKYINRYFLLPVFDFISSHISSMGIVILLLTLLIRLLTSPILYKSYLSGAKMKVLKPEVDALKEKYKDDQQTFGMEQMKLWRSAGVNPLGGCIPALLQIPIFMSLYYFFQSNIDLRGKGFLWANDLAQYDSIAQLPFNIPFYGDHVSLFTLTAVITSLVISLYSMTNMQDNSNPLMKYMPYIFPVMLLGIFNKLPAALTWYYTISNTITLLLQVVIQKYIIDHDKIMSQMAENRKKPVKKSKWQERIDAMQESQKKLQEMKNKKS